MGTKTKFMLSGECIGYTRDLRRALDYHERLCAHGLNVQAVSMNANIPDKDIDGKRYRYVMTNLFTTSITTDVFEYFDYVLSE